MNDKRFRAFMLVLYPDDATHEDALLFIKEFFDYAYILHDKDFTDTGEIKKPHYHVVIKFQNSRTLNSLSKELKIGENYITPTKKNYTNGLRYLIHFDDEDKYQYSIDEVIGPLKKQLKKSIDKDKDETDAVFELLELIENEGYLSMQAFIRLIAGSGLWTYYRRNAYTFNLLLTEHNQKIMRQKGEVNII